MADDTWFSAIVSDPAKLKREAGLRRRTYKQVSVPRAMVPEYLGDGWEVDRELRTRTRLRKPFAHDERLENKLWYLFYLLGYPQLSTGRNFQATIVKQGAKPILKQLDVFAKDDETVVVAECKSSSTLTRRSLQKDLGEFASLKGPIAHAVKKHYGPGFKPKIIWMFVTNNIVWSEPDKERAKSHRINIVRESELRYYLQIAEHLRSAARFQFLAEFLGGQKIPELDGVKVPAVRGRLGGKTFYSFVSTPEQMLKIAFVNHRSLNDPAGAPSYQRLISRARLRQISRYITGGGFFPTNILVNFTARCRFEHEPKDQDTNVAFGTLYLPNKYRSAWIIDGQHRLYGYAPLSPEYLSQNIMVVAFEMLKKEEEARMFVDINHEQKSVPKTLLDDLEGDLKWGSDRPAERVGAISARLIGLMNSEVGEALYGRVTQQGIAPTERTCLTVPALKTGLRRSKLVGEAILNKKEYSPGPLSGKDDTETLQRACTVLNAFFGLLSDANSPVWDVGRQGFLCTNVALEAYLRLLGALIAHMEAQKSLTARELEPVELVTEVKEYMEPILEWLTHASIADMEEHFKVQYGSGGPSEYFYRLCVMVHGEFPEFEPDGLGEWALAQSAALVDEADRKLKELNVMVQKVIFDTFKQHYGTEGDAYWDKGVTDKNIKARAYAKSLDDELDVRLPLENYLDFIEYKKIVENKAHWQWFKPIFDIPEPGEKGHAKNLKWMERVNELRRISAHPTEKRSYKADDFDYIEYVYEEFVDRLNGQVSAELATSD